jgi:cold shock protein
MATGVVKVFFDNRNFGFITPDDNGPDVFVHGSIVKRSGLSAIEQGDKVAYDLVPNNGRFAATNIKIID